MRRATRMRARAASRRGISLVEVLLGLTIMMIAVLGTLSYFAYGMSGIRTQGNRRAALERARQRMEQLLAANITLLQPADTLPRWVRCTGTPCAWTLFGVQTTETTPVDDGATYRMETTVQYVDDIDTPPAGETDAPDALLLDVKVWFTSQVGLDDDLHRVHLRSLRTG